MTGSKGNFLILGASFWQTHIIRKVRELGYSVIATDMNPNAEGFKLADYSEPVDITDLDGTLRVARKYNICAIASDQTDLAMPSLAHVCSQMHLVGPSPTTAINTTNKRVMRELTQDYLPTPKWFVTEDREECVARTKDIGFPVVIKPPDSQASRGVNKVDTVEKVGPAFDEALEFSREGTVLVEEFMVGREATVEAFHDSAGPHLLGVSLKLHTPPPRIIATNLDFPAQVSDKVMGDIEWTFNKLVSLLGIERGPIHGEIILSKNGPMLVEMANRGGGSGTFSHLIPAITGVDCLDAYVRQCAGEDVRINRTCNRAGVMRFKIYPDGLVSDIQGLDEAMQIPGVVIIVMYIKPGDELKPIRMDTQRHALIISEAETLDDASKVITEVENTIKVIYK